MGIDSKAQRSIGDWRVDRADSGPSGSGDLAPNGFEGDADGQINIKGDRSEIDRFRRLAKRDGFRLIGLLRRALDAYEREVAAGYIHFRR
jgi:hypothetical protein